jgi:hypothetical protein
LTAQGFHVDIEKGSLGEDELVERLRNGNYQILGIRSKTNVTAKVVEAANSVSHTLHPSPFLLTWLTDGGVPSCSSLVASALARTK